jgi:hypothetical protein
VNPFKNEGTPGIKLIKPKTIYLHEIELNASPDLETHIEDIVRHMYQDYNKTSKE